MTAPLKMYDGAGPILILLYFQNMPDRYANHGPDLDHMGDLHISASACETSGHLKSGTHDSRTFEQCKHRHQQSSATRLRSNIQASCLTRRARLFPRALACLPRQILRFNLCRKQVHDACPATVQINCSNETARCQPLHW